MDSVLRIPSPANIIKVSAHDRCAVGSLINLLTPALAALNDPAGEITQGQLAGIRRLPERHANLIHQLRRLAREVGA